MSKTKMIEPVSKMYAKALFELASEKSVTDQLFEELKGFSETISANKELKDVFFSMMFSPSEKSKIFEALKNKLNLSDILFRFSSLLIEKNRIGRLDEIVSSYQSLLDKSKNVVRGSVTTAEKLSESEGNEISQAIGKKLGKKVILEQVIDREILGGLVVKVQGLVFDGSLKTTINRLRESLERQSL